MINGRNKEELERIVSGYRIILILLTLVFILMWLWREKQIEVTDYRQRLERMELYYKIEDLEKEKR